MRNFKILMAFLLSLSLAAYGKTRTVDVLIVGGGASGTCAGIQAARMGVNTLIVEEHEWLGGALTSAGVSCIDGCYYMPGGLFGEFRNGLIKHYGKEDAMHTAWVAKIAAEPSAMNKVLKGMAGKEKDLQVYYNSIVRTIRRDGDNWIVTINKDNTPETIKAKILIDGTEMGDIAKMCGVKYDIGMEARELCGESIAPDKANDIIQDITYVAILKDYGKDVTIAKPEGYNPSLFYCTCEVPECTNPKEADRLSDCDNMMRYGKLPNNKYMINWPIEGNDFYVNLIEMTPEERTKALDKAKNITLCYLYYIQTALGYNTLGLADDEYSTADKLPFIPYHRESRRIHGKVRFDLNHISSPYTQPEKLYRTCIAVGDYPVDHHHARYSGWAELPNLYFYPVPSFGLPLGTLLPESTDGLIVTEKSISVSNLANGTTRVQPVLMQIGQAAGVLAALSVSGKKLEEVSIRDVQRILLNANGYLLPFRDLPLADKHFAALQRIGSTGILQGRGANNGWIDETWFDTDSCLTKEALLSGQLKEYYPEASLGDLGNAITIGNAFSLIKQLGDQYGKNYNALKDSEPKEQWISIGLDNFEPDRNITRKEFAVLLDDILDPFNKKEVNLKGEIK